MKRTLTITVLLAVAAALLPAQDQAGVQAAIRFERAKDAADARQARFETAPAETKPDDGVQQAIAFEKAKDAGDQRQARIEARQHAGVTTARGSATPRQ